MRLALDDVAPASQRIPAPRPRCTGHRSTPGTARAGWRSIAPWIAAPRPRRWSSTSPSKSRSWSAVMGVPVVVMALPGYRSDPAPPARLSPRRRDHSRRGLRGSATWHAHACRGATGCTMSAGCRGSPDAARPASSLAAPTSPRPFQAAAAPAFDRRCRGRCRGHARLGLRRLEPGAWSRIPGPNCAPPTSSSRTPAGALADVAAAAPAVVIPGLPHDEQRATARARRRRPGRDLGGLPDDTKWSDLLARALDAGSTCSDDVDGAAERAARVIGAVAADRNCRQSAPCG